MSRIFFVVILVWSLLASTAAAHAQAVYNERLDIHWFDKTTNFGIARNCQESVRS
ncbi:MAG: hypothetical protein JWM04_2418 [Verrucomicrobiales bacterium]|nr:hypothetical protein [Verrucomicrobiales bacterium]